MNTKTLARSIQLALALVFAFTALAAARPQVARAESCQTTYTVKEGETIFRIAKKFDTTAYKLARANNMERPYILTVGQQLCIPKVPQPSSDYSWTARIRNGKVVVTGDDFKKSWNFFLKVREDFDEPWYKLGKIIINKQGEMDAAENLPRSLSNASVLYVCLKDGVTNYLDCKRVFK